MTHSATTGSKRNGGKGSNGGVWEWTSTVFESVEGFEPSKLYPGYVVFALTHIRHNFKVYIFTLATLWISLMGNIMSW